MLKKQFLTIPISAAATIFLLPLNQKIAPLFQFQMSDNPAINRMATAQILTLGVVGSVLLLIRLLNPGGFRKYWRLGEFAAPAEKVAWLGIKAGESWRLVGAGFRWPSQPRRLLLCGLVFTKKRPLRGLMRCLLS